MGTNAAVSTPSTEQEPREATNATSGFDLDMIKKYPKSNKKISLNIHEYSILTEDSPGDPTQSIHISPHGVQFQAQKEYPIGALLKINVNIPNYWVRKQQVVDYRRIDTPDNFRILGKVIHTEDIGKRGKKKIITVQTLNIDEVDEVILKSYLMNG